MNPLLSVSLGAELPLGHHCPLLLACAFVLKVDFQGRKQKTSGVLEGRRYRREGSQKTGLASTATTNRTMTTGGSGLWGSAGTHLQPSLANGCLAQKLSGIELNQRYCLPYPKGETKHLSERETYFYMSSVP